MSRISPASAGGTPNMESLKTDEQNAGYQIDHEKIKEIFEAAQRGDITTVLQLTFEFGLGWYTYDIERLTRIGNEKAPLESNGDALASLLQTHKDGTVSINENMKLYLNEGRKLMAAPPEGSRLAANPPSAEIDNIINKVINQQGINEGEAKKLYSWCLEAKEYVIPPEFRTEIISSQLKGLQEKYEQELLKGAKLTESFIRN